jgi:tRNA threonylcarbamoyladenosine biosynthesis protein TsaB
MSLILNIDTSVETASVCLSLDGEVLQLDTNDHQKNHAAWLHVAIEKVLKDAQCTIAEIKAVAVSIGPGSYTGLRVGLSTAKGICYAMTIPLIAIGTLDMMAYAAKSEEGDLICPMIDARRMEVFTAMYDKTLKQTMEPLAMIVNEKSFEEILGSKKIIFSGNGRHKLQKVISSENAFFCSIETDATHLARLSEIQIANKRFADLTYVQPFYLKEFYSPQRKPLG